MNALRTVAALLFGYVLVVLLTEFGFRLFPGGRAPKGGPAVMMILATLIAVAAGLVGGYVAAAFSRMRPLAASSIVSVPLVIESIWLLTTRSRPENFWYDLMGAVTLIGSTIAGGALRAFARRDDATRSTRAAT